MSIRWGAALALALAASGAQARENLCGSATVASPEASLFVTAGQRDGQAPFINYVYAETTNTEKTFSLKVHYDPAGEGLSEPIMLSLASYMPLPEPKAAQPERLAWRLAEGTWTIDNLARKPQRRWADPANVEGYLSATIAGQARRAEWLGLIDQGFQLSVKRLDAAEETLATGEVRYPPRAAIVVLYAKARRDAIARLKSCGPPLVIPPARN